jgi:hypothetical protein
MLLSKEISMRDMMHIGGSAVHFIFLLWPCLGSGLPITAKALGRARYSPFWICGGQSDTGTDLSPSSSIFPCQYNSAVTLHTHLTPLCILKIVFQMISQKYVLLNRFLR